jgi:predicted flap endonuclease-1-like 5' DNA nuclease
MPELSISEPQREALEAIREDLEAAYVGEYGTVRTTDAVQYLLDTYTPPEAADTERSTADVEALTSIDGVGEATAESLADAGVRSVAGVASADPETIAGIEGIGDGQAVDMVASATEIEAGGAEGDDTGGGEVGADGTEASDSKAEASADPATGREEAESPEDTLQQAMSLLDAHGERWRESDGDEPYEVDLPDGSTEAVRTKDDVRRLLFKHWK